ncbi:MAG: HEAT repeat domain-containing protein [Leptolyngbya sp. RL_3_1]|nr:HEAT repeat domain-containing protein [Leptolyngbya sp. RL_3_1]
MELHQIESNLASPNPQNRMKAMVELRNHAPEVVVPLLKQRMHDREFIVRSFVAMGLGNKQTEEGFAALLDLIACDSDANVVAEAANSLAKFGDAAVPHLVQLFERNSHWLVRQSILAALEGVGPEILMQLCRWGWEGEDLVVQGNAIAMLGQLCGTPQETLALAILLEAATAEADMIRAQAARTLKEFDQHPQAQAALATLRQDTNLRVVGATFESLV